MFDQRGLARAVRSQDGDQIAAADFQVDILQNKRSIIAIAEIHIFEETSVSPRLSLFRPADRCDLFLLPLDPVHHPFGRQLDLFMIDLRRQSVIGPRYLTCPPSMYSKRSGLAEMASSTRCSISITVLPSSARLRKTVQRFVRRRGVKGGKRFVQQQNGRVHRQHPGQGHFCFSPPERLNVSRSRRYSNPRRCMARSTRSNDLVTRQAPGFQDQRQSR
jgi:hypothetical protein